MATTTNGVSRRQNLMASPVVKKLLNIIDDSHSGDAEVKT